MAHGYIVPDYRISEILWSEDEPPTAEAQLRTYVYGLRKALGSDAKIVRQSPGYRLEVSPDQIDLVRFERLVADGRRSMVEQRIVEAAQQFRAALDLWQGPALSGVTEPLARIEQPRLEEARLAVVEDWVDAQLTLGQHHELISELTKLVSEQPLRERLRAQFMVALYRSGQQADALNIFHDARRVLSDELGIDPGLELRRTYESILQGEPGLNADGSQGTVRLSSITPLDPGLATVARRRQLPPDIADFSGREKEIGQLCALLKSSGGTSVVPVITGMAGVGKTALAVHAAHLCVEHFTGGQLSIDLGGDRPDPPGAVEVLGRLLLMLGADGSAIPEGLNERTRLYRDRLAGLNVLVLLDNAAGEGQVRPLLPNDSGCRVVVTSRMRLAALEGSQIIDLNTFERDSAMELLARIISPERVAADLASADRILRMCGFLPLAVRIAAARLAARPHWSLARMANTLENHRRRLDELRFGDLEVRTGLILAYRGLSPLARRAFRLLSLPDGPSFGVWLGAALLDVSMQTAEEVIESLVDARLLLVTRTEGSDRYRYQFHDLVRVLARERAAEEGHDEECSAAYDRAVAAALELAEAADERLPSQCFGIIRGQPPHWRLDPAALEVVADDPIAWFEAEREGLVAMVMRAGALDRPHVAWQLAQALTNFFDLRGLYDDWSQTHNHALDVAERVGDRLGQATMLRGLAERSAFFSDNVACLDYAQRAQELFEQLGEAAGQADALYYCGDVYRQTGHPVTAITFLEQGMRCAASVGHLVGEAQLSEGLGKVHKDQGRLEEALHYYERSAAIWHRLGKSRYRAIIMRSVGIIERDLGRFSAATLRFEECLAIFGELGDRVAEAYTRNSLGDLCRTWGSPDRARAQYEQAIDIFMDLGLERRFGYAVALRGIGALELAEGRLGSAIDQLTRSLEIWRELGMPLWEARTLLTLGDALAVRGDTAASSEAWRDAFELARRLEVPEIAELRRRLGT